MLWKSLTSDTPKMRSISTEKDSMEKRTGKQGGKRAIVALVALISGAGLPFTGLAVHALKSGSSRGALHSFIVMHEMLGVVFTVSSIWHVILNRKALVDHIRCSTGEAVRVSREALWAIMLVVAVLLLGLGHTFFAH